MDDLRQRFGKELHKSDNCTQSDCTYEIEVSNRPLAALAVLPYTEMRTYFWTRNGQLLGSMVDYTTVVDRQYTIVSHVQLDICDTCSAFGIHPWGDSSSLDTNGIVEIGNTVSAQDRRAVLSFDSNCMTRLGGCKSIADLLPSVWQKTSAGTIACKIPNDRGSASKCNTL